MNKKWFFDLSCFPLFTACAGSGSGSGGLPFEVWCRYYHPNVRDQCVAKVTKIYKISDYNLLYMKFDLHKIEMLFMLYLLLKH